MTAPQQTILLKELLKTEVEELKIKWDALQSFDKHVPFTVILNSFEETVVKGIRTKIDALKHCSEKELAPAFILLKRAIIECRKWLELNLEAYQIVHPNSPLNDVDRHRYNSDREVLDVFFREADSYLPKVLSLSRSRRPVDFMAHALRGHEKILPSFSEILDDSSEAPRDLKEAMRLFLEHKKNYLKIICDYAHQHFEKWDRLVFEEGRGLYIHVPSLFPFPLLYSIQGFLYVVMEVKGLLLGIGSGKFGTRCIELIQGEVYALIKPRSRSVNEPTEERKKQQAEWNFLDAWKESKFLVQLQGCRGVLQLHDRLAFLKDDQQHLYLIEQLYPDGSLYHNCKKVIDQKQPDKKLSLKQKLLITHDVLCGLKNIHEKGIVHHDIKADNIFLSLAKGDETAVIADFNMSYSVDDELGKEAAKSIPRWSAPEIAYCQTHPELSLEEALKYKTFALDVWALGIALYILFYYEYPPWWEMEPDQTNEYVANLKDGWLQPPHEAEFIFPLLKKMLDPKRESRCSAAEALALFEQIQLRTDDLP